MFATKDSRSCEVDSIIGDGGPQRVEEGEGRHLADQREECRATDEEVGAAV